MPEFIPGLKLCEAFYWQAVRPILDAAFPGLAHTSALIGYGSDVLGYDRSRRPGRRPFAHRRRLGRR